MLAATAALFAACAETDLVNEVNVVAEPQAIGFETFANKATRAEGDAAGTTTTTALEFHHKSFNVWASKKLTNENYADVYGGKTTLGIVTYDAADATIETDWKASPLKFWDKAALNYYFYAAAPTDAEWSLTSTEGIGDDNTVGTNGKFKLTGFTLAGTNLATATSDEPVGTWINKQGDKDLMVAEPVTFNDITNYTKADPDPVSFTFRHILSKLNIQVKGIDLTDYDAKIYLNALDVVGLNNVADYTESTEDCDWSNWEKTVNPLTLKGGWNGTSLELPNGYVYTHEYLVIPQTVDYTAWMNQGTAPNVPYIYIDYNVTTTENSETFTENFKSYYGLADIFGNAALNFAEGGQYTLSVSIAPDVIEFNTTETPWTEQHTQGENPDVDIK